MNDREPTRDELLAQVEELRARLGEAEDILRAIQDGDVDALVLPTSTGPRVFSVQQVQADALLVPPSAGPRVFSLHAAEEPYRLLIERMNEGAATLMPDGLILYCNHRLAELLRLPLERVQGERLHDFVAPQEQEALNRILDQAEQGCAGNLHLLPREGLPIPTILSLCSIRVADNTYIGAVITDVSTFRKAEKALRESEERFRKLQLQRAEAKIERLESILPICSSCHKVRNDQNYWQQVESYVSQHTGVMFSHGLCPECAQKAMKDAREELGIADRPPAPLN